jgi:hypothetical protein
VLRGSSVRLDCELLRVQTCIDPLVEGCLVKWLTVAVLILGTFVATVSSQPAPMDQETRDRLRAFSGWLRLIRPAENEYKSKYGRYGDLSDLRKAHLLDALIFESDPSPGTHRGKQIVPKSTLFQVKVSGDGEHFRATISEGCVSVETDDTGRQGWGYCPPSRRGFPRDLKDGPEGPIIALPG